MPRPKGAKNKKKKDNSLNPKVLKVREDKLQCACCTKGKKEEDFYMSQSTLYAGLKRLPICKGCLDLEFERLIKRYNYDIEKSLYYMCMRLDFPFIYSVIEGAKKQSEKLGTSIHRVYIQKINSQGDINNYGSVFLDGEILKPVTKRSEEQEKEPIERIDTSINGIKEQVSLQIEADEELRHKWGAISPKDIVFLETEFQEWTTRYDVSSKSMEILVKEICYQQLSIKKKREAGQGAEKELKTLQELMGNTALKPIQESAAQSTDTQTFGTLIKKWENEYPVPEPDPEFADVDGVKKYIGVWFFGHLCRMLGIENDYSRQYDEETLKYTVNLPESGFDSVDTEGEDGVDVE
jgi:hypothetical protein